MPTTKETRDEHLQLVEDCENRESRMTDWQRTFVDSIRRQLEAGRTLTTKQAETLSDVWEQVTAGG